MEETEEKKTGFWNKIIDIVYDFSTSFNKFRRSSFLSIFFILVLFLLVQALDQAYTLLIDMVERDWISLIASYIIIGVFALVLSHYPIYTYYAKDINDSKDSHYWYVHLWFKIYKIFTYAPKPNRTNYKQDYMAKYLRYSLGLLVFCIWHYYITKSFEPKLVFAYDGSTLFKKVNILFYGIPFILMAYLLYIKQKKEQQNCDYKEENNTEKNAPEYDKFNKKGSLIFLSSMLTSIVLLLLICIVGGFNCGTYWALQILTSILVLTYILFRLFRTKVYDHTSFPIIKYISIDFNYILFFFIIAIIVVLLLIYSNLAVAYGWGNLSAMVILFSYIYIIYYTLACSLKYLFVMRAINKQVGKKEDNSDVQIDLNEYYNASGLDNDNISKIMGIESQRKIVKRSRYVVSGIILLFLIFGVLSFKFNERRVHQLDTENTVQGKTLSLADYKKALAEKINTGKPIFFVASHGGALKANIWTMKLLNKLQKETQGQFLDQSVSFSGASGGMLGLSMYSVLAGKYQNQYKEIDTIIDRVALKNYASMDISYTLGWDFIRKVYPLNYYASPFKDRAYYSMVAYQNLLESKEGRTLNSSSFLSYWKKNIYDTNTYFPALLVNTAKTNGRRGVFCSVDYGTKNIFLNADNLSRLNNGQAVSFYQAVSCTNRFPGFSPAAKIKNYGHYIDAGAIDNSGLLTTLDWYDYLMNGENAVISENSNVVFVEVINGKTNYAKYLIDQYKKEHPEDKIFFEEKETGNLAAVVSAGANLDKNPNYFSDLVKRLSERPDRNITYMPIYLPRILTIDDIEKFIGGDLEPKLKGRFEDFLTKENNKVHKITESETEKCSWDTYEPTLARHLSVSTIAYYDSILKKSDDIRNKVLDIHELLKTKKVDTLSISKE